MTTTDGVVMKLAKIMIKQYEVKVPAFVNTVEKPDIRRRCKHDRKKIFRIQQRNNTIAIKNICLDCGHADNPMKKNVFVPDILISFPVRTTEQIEEFREKVIKITTDKWERYNESIAKSKETFDALWWEWYTGYLQSDVWKERRQKVLEREHYVCEACKEEKANHVHHTTYEHAGREPLFELRALCETCHDDIHKGGSKL